MAVCIDLTDDGNEKSAIEPARDVIDLTKCPVSFVPCPVIYPENVPTQTQTDPSAIDLTDDPVDNDENENSLWDPLADGERSFSSVSDIVDLTEEPSQSTTNQVSDNRVIGVDTNALTHLSKTTLNAAFWDELKDLLHSPAVAKLIKENAQCPKVSTVNSEFSTVQATEDRSIGTNAQTHLSNTTPLVEQNSVLPSPTIANLMEESALDPTSCNLPSEFSPTRTTKDRSVNVGPNARADLSDRALWDGQHSGTSLSTIVDLTEEDDLLPGASTPTEFSATQATEDRSTDVDISARAHSSDTQRSDLTSPTIVDLMDEDDLFPIASNSTSEFSITPAEDSYIDAILLDTQKSDLTAPNIVDLMEEDDLFPTPSTSTSECSITQAAEDRSIAGATNALTDLSNTTLDQNCDLPLTSIAVFPEESSLYRTPSTSPSELSTTQATEDSDIDSNARSHFSDTTSCDGEDSDASLSDPDESLLRPLVVAPSNESSSVMDWESMYDINELDGHLESFQQKILDLENVVVDLNDEDVTSFQLIDDYKTQACRIYDRIKKVSGKREKRKDNRIRFNGTPYPDFNAKLQHYVNKKKRLPVFEKVLKSFKQYIEDHRLQLGQEECYGVGM